MRAKLTEGVAFSLIDGETQYFLAGTSRGSDELNPVHTDDKWFGCSTVGTPGGLCEVSVECGEHIGGSKAERDRIQLLYREMRMNIRALSFRILVLTHAS